MKSISVASSVVFFFVNSDGLASPTPSEFIRCKTMAVGVLDHCLKDNSYYKNDFCWQESKETYDSCSKEVFKSHSPETRKLNKIKYRAAMEKKRELEQKKLLDD